MIVRTVHRVLDQAFIASFLVAVFFGVSHYQCVEVFVKFYVSWNALLEVLL